MTSDARSLAACAALLVLFWSPADAGTQPTSEPKQEQTVPAAQSIGNEADALSRAREAIVQNHLTSVADTCLKLEIESTSHTMYVVTVYEVHSDKCGGDPAVQPRLFGLHISRKSGKVWTDANSDDGEFELLPK
jgi:hypothetical protein